jgi:transcription antitermination protein NusB
MSIPKQKFREIILQLLYSYDMAKPDEGEVISIIMETLSVSKKTVREAFSRMNQILEKRDEIDKLIESSSLSYSLERIQRVERNIIRLGAFELLYDEEIPPKVAITEAMRLAKKFSTPEAASFVNALLDAFYKMREGEKVDLDELKKKIELLELSQKAAEGAVQNRQEEKK